MPIKSSRNLEFYVEPYYVKRPIRKSTAMFRYMAVRPMTIALSSLMPFPKHKAAETSSRVQICSINKTIVEADIVTPNIVKKMSDVNGWMYGKMAMGKEARKMHVRS